LLTRKERQNKTKGGKITMRNNKTKTKTKELYCIHDSEEKRSVFAIGTEEQLKEWWWDTLIYHGEVGGYQLEPFDE
jgi:hypothetical protein